MKFRQWAALTAVVTMVSAQVDFASACSTQAFNMAGQTIRLTVTFYTNDPNEDGEGEPVLIGSSGGFFVQQDSHVQQTYDVLSTVDNEVFTGTFGGEAPDGDESCSLSTDTQKKDVLTPDQKRLLQTLMNDIRLGILVQAAACGSCLFLPPPYNVVCGGLCLIASTGDGLLLWRVNQWLNDPVDPNFMVLITPTFTMLTCASPAGVPASVANTCDALYLSDQHSIGLLQALLATTNKVQGAVQAGDAYWEGQQMANLEAIEAELASDLGAQPTLRANFRAALEAWGYPSQSFTPNDIHQVEADILGRSQGSSTAFPIDINASLASLGATPDDISNVVQTLITQNIDTVAAIGAFPASLTWQPAIDDLTAASHGFGGQIATSECWNLRALRPYPVAVVNPIDVPVADRFGSSVATIRTKPKGGCVPANNGPLGPSALPMTGQTEIYPLKGQRMSPRTVTVMNELAMVGSLVTLLKADSLRVPATFPEWPFQAGPIPRRLQCYKATGPSLDATLSQIADGYAFVFAPVHLRNPSHVCVPVDLHGLDPGALSSPEALVCYKAHADISPGGNLSFFVMSENVSSDDGTTSSVHNGMSFSTLREYCIPSSIK